MHAIREDVPLTARNTLGLPSGARYALRIDDAGTLPAQLAALEDDPRVYGLSRIVLGGGSNVVLPETVRGLVLEVAIGGRACVGETDTDWIVEAGAGENWHDFVAWTLDAGYPGLENLALIPGTVGAAPVQNIGAYGLELARFCQSVRAWDFSVGMPVELQADDCAFAYRDSVFKRESGRFLITHVRFALPKVWQANTGYAELAATLRAAGIGTPAPRDIFDAVVAIRRRKLPDPATLGNAGSFFKNPVVDAATHAALRAREPGLVAYAQADGRYKLAAGWLVERCGFKGQRRGAVGVHDQQALVLVHFGGGDATALLALAAEIRDAVRERFGVTLEIEPVVL